MKKWTLLLTIASLIVACSPSNKTATMGDLTGEAQPLPADANNIGTDGGADAISSDLHVGKDGGKTTPDVIGDDSGGLDDLGALDGDSGGTLDDVEPTDATVPVDIVEPPDIPEPTVKVSTYAEASTAPAGVPLQFNCVVQGLAEGTYVTYLQIAGPQDVDVDDLAVTFYKKGKYSVACRVKWEEGEEADPTPLKIEVVAGKAQKIETELSKYDVKAGETVSATCTVHDGYDNLIMTPTKIVVNPDIGVDIYGLKILTVKKGTYMVACVEPSSGLVDPTPATLVVGWGIPKKIVTELGTDAIVAGDSTTVTCTAYDNFGNKVPDYPMVVFLSPGLDIDGTAVTGTKTGAYQVICVPHWDDWDFFTLTPQVLTIMAGPASGVSLQPVPDMPTYFMFVTIQFIVSAVDDYGNVVEGAEVLPLAYEPEDPGIIKKGDLKYKFETEGTFVFSACLAENPQICGIADITVDGYGPVITIKYPERGATIMGKPAVNITGNVIDPVSGVESFTINNNIVPLDENGDFVYPVTAKQGLNMIVAIAEDPNGFKTLLVQSYYYSPVWHEVDINDPEGSQIEDSILLFLGEEAFDKIPHDYSKPDNLSTILEMALSTLDIGSFLPNPVASAGPYKVYVGPFYYDPPTIHVFPIPGGMLAEVHIYDIKVKVEAKGSCKILFVDLCPDVSGWVEMDELQLWEGLNIWSEDGDIKMSQYENFIGIYGLDLKIDGILGFLFGWLINWFIDAYVGELEKTAMDMVTDQIDSIAGGLLEGFALNQQLEVPNPIDPNAPPVELSLVSKIRELLFTHVGVELRMDAAVLAPKNINKNPLGSIGRASCLKWVPETFYIDKDQWALMALHDDMLNEVLFAAWYAGLLDMVLPLEEFIDMDSIGDLGFGSLEDMGIKDIVVSTEFFLPPIITSCNDPWDEIMQFQIGDIYIELNMKMLNEPVTVGLFASMAADAIIEVNDVGNSQEISLAIGTIDPMVMQVTHISDNLKGAEGFMTMIIQGMLLPSLLGSFAEGSLASFPLPSIDVSALAAQFLPPGIVWKLVIDSFFRELGYTSLIAHIEAL
jgi:hypothetical protein